MPKPKSKPKPYDYSDPRPPSRSQKKRDSAALQVLGGKLAELPESALKRLDLAPRLLEAIKEFKALAKHEAKRRQLQFIGALMRETDADPLARAVEDMEAGNRTQAREFHAVEHWRTALLAGDESGLEGIVALAPEEEQVEVRGRIRLLARNARAEAEKNKPPRSSRALFRLLRELRQSSQGDMAGALPDEDIEAQGQDDFSEEHAVLADAPEQDENEMAESEAQADGPRKTSF
jgi:ribosome-associated protein